MRRWALTIALDPRHELPIFLQLAQAIADAIRRGRLKPGEALPGTRELAEQLGLNRNTVVSGYEELAAEGLVHTRVGGGTFVTSSLPAQTSAGPSTKDAPTFPLAEPMHVVPAVQVPAPGTLMIAHSLPDTRLFPAEALTRAFRRAIVQRGRSLIGYAEPCGHPRLREELAKMLRSTRALPATADCLMVTRSLEQGIDLVARMLLKAGDVVAVESFGYPPAWSVLRLAGARLMPVPVDDEGMDIGALEDALKHQSIRAVFLTPHHQFPTACVMSAARRERLAALATRHHFAIIEDDYDHEFHYAGKPILPIAAGPVAATLSTSARYPICLRRASAPDSSMSHRRCSVTLRACVRPAIHALMWRWNAPSPNCSKTANCCAICAACGVSTPRAAMFSPTHCSNISAAPCSFAFPMAVWGYGRAWTMPSMWIVGAQKANAKACNSLEQNATTSISANSPIYAWASAISMKPNSKKLCSAWRAPSRG